MNEKRFRLGADFDGFNNIYDNERTIGCERTIYATKMVKLLNELNDENQTFREALQELKEIGDYQAMRINELNDENRELEQQVEDLYENDKSLRKMMGSMTHNFQGVCVKEDLFNEVLKVLKEIEADDLYDDLWKTSIVTGVNGC